MFTQTLKKRVLGSDLVNLLTGPHGVDRYTELVAPTWTLAEGRAKVVDVRRNTPRSVTLVLAPNEAFADTVAPSAGQYVNLSVEIDGRRHTRCYSPANAEGAAHLELTIGHHDGGLVSTFLYERARRGMVVGLAGVGGDFVLPAQRPRRILFVSGGSGITPVMAMLRTLVNEGHAGEIAFVHYARNRAEALLPRRARRRCPACGCCTATPVRPAAISTAGSAPSTWRRRCRHPTPYSSVAQRLWSTRSASTARTCTRRASWRRRWTCPREPSGGRVTFADSSIDIVDDGRSLLEQAESAGLTPESGCRMGICHTCTRRKTSGVVRNLTTGAVSTAPDEDVQICVSVPVGDVDIAL